MKTAARGQLVALVLASGCSPEALPPRAQYIVHVNTDASLPANAANVPALFDTVRFDLYPPGSPTRCASCSRAFALDETTVRSGNASVGIVPEDPLLPPLMRIWLYVAAVEIEEEPSLAGSIGAWVALPILESDGLHDVTVVLRTDDVGTVRGTQDAPIEPERGPPDPTLAGSWPWLARIGCAEPPGPGEACVPGGAFWMGHPLFAIAPLDAQSDVRRIVVLSPFFIDTHEVTVRELRESGLARHEPEDDPRIWTGETVKPLVPPRPDDARFCTYTPGPLPSGEDPLRERPVTCISWELAAEYCQGRGSELPTEAQLEYVMGGLRSSSYVWGAEAPRCRDAVFARFYTGIGYGYGSCLPPTAAAGPLDVGSADRDALILDGTRVFDLSGNATEWARDHWNRQDEPCWGAGVLHDPWCMSPSPADPMLGGAIKGGSWALSGELMHAAKRWRMEPDYRVDFETGFRCTRPAGPAYGAE